MITSMRPTGRLEYKHKQRGTPMIHLYDQGPQQPHGRKIDSSPGQTGEIPHTYTQHRRSDNGCELQGMDRGTLMKAQRCADKGCTVYTHQEGHGWPHETHTAALDEIPQIELNGAKDRQWILERDRIFSPTKTEGTPALGIQQEVIL